MRRSHHYGLRFFLSELLRFTAVDKDKIARIYPGVAFQRESDSKTIAAFQAKYQLKKYILFVGNRKWHKNGDGLIRAFSLLRDLDLDLILIGSKKEARERIFFYENIPDEELKLFYQLAEVTVVPSFYEGFGLAAVEAMALGSPLVVSHRASLPEVCADAALYVDPDSPDEIAAKIRMIVSDHTLRKELCMKGRERAEHFRWEKSAFEHQQEIEKLCSA